MKEDPVVHRDLQDYQVLAAHQDRRELRETKVNLVKPVLMGDLERREIKGRKVTQAPQGSKAHRAELVKRDQKATEGTPVRRVPQDHEVPLAHQDSKDQWVHLDPQDLRAHQGHKVLREVLVQRERTDSQVPQEQEVLQAPGEMMETPAVRVSRESLGLVDSVDLMAILVTRVTLVHWVPQGWQVLLALRDQEGTGDRSAKEEPPVLRVIQDRKDCRDFKDRAETLVQKERKDCKDPREKKETRDGLVSSVLRELLAHLVIRVTLVLPDPRVSQDPKVTEVRTGTTDLPDHQGRQGLGEALVYRVPREIEDHKEKGVTKALKDLQAHRDLQETSVHS